MSIGLDIGHFNSKLIQLNQKGANITIVKIGSNKNFENLATFDPETITKSQWVANIQDLLQSLKIKPRTQKILTSSLIASSTTIKQILTLDLGGDELTQSLEFEAKKHIPLDGTEVIKEEVNIF